MTKAKVQKCWDKKPVNLSLFVDQPWHAHAEFLKCEDIDTQEPVRINFSSCNDCVD
jgi:hypothetical protein